MTTQAFDPTAILQAEAGESVIALKDELERLQALQAEDQGAPPPGVTKEAYDILVRDRCRRAIEIIATLRRTNTGPAKATGSRAKGTRKKTDMAALRSKLLD